MRRRRDEIKDIKEMLSVLRERDNALRNDIIGMEWAIKDLKEQIKQIKEGKEMTK